ncbi:hypothetical protein Hdeb2414_s0006g00212961 [Helianthus debilis subsp. tardiflorus]
MNLGFEKEMFEREHGDAWFCTQAYDLIDMRSLPNCHFLGHHHGNSLLTVNVKLKLLMVQQSRVPPCFSE